MKNVFQIKNLFLASATVFLLTSCDQAPKGDNAQIKDEQQASESKVGTTFVIDTAESKIRFTGNGVGKNHPGTFKLKSGQAVVSNNTITAGNFVIDVKSMEMEEKGDMFQKDLRTHLQSGDFFDAEKFGTAKFEITSVQPYKADDKQKSLVEGANYNVSGNLTIKDVTKNITFPARIDLDENTLKAKANFDIDRRQWQMNYGNDKTLGDKFISETVNLELNLQAKKQ